MKHHIMKSWGMTKSDKKDWKYKLMMSEKLKRKKEKRCHEIDVEIEEEIKQIEALKKL